MTAPSPVDELADSMRPLCEQSVDELDVCVALEMEGINDTVAMSKYGARDVADLAEQLTRRIPARVREVHDPNSSQRIAYVRLACRGLLFAVPGLFYLVIARSERSTVAGYTVLASMLVGWGLSQALAVVAYRVLGRSGKRSAAIELRRCLIGAAYVGVFALLVGIVVGPALLVAMAVGQILYVMAATILLFHSADRLLALSLVPGAALSACFLTGVESAAPIALSGIALTVGVAMSLAWWTTRSAGRGDGPMDTARVEDVIASIPFVANGVLTGIAVAYLPLRLLAGAAPPAGQRIDLTIIPLVLSMGFAEIELMRLQAAGRRLMRRCHQVADYRRGSLILVARAQAGFMLVLCVISLVVACVLRMTIGFSTRDLTLLGAYSALGVALLAGLVLVSVDRVHVALRGFLGTATLIAIGWPATRLAGITLTMDGGYLVSCLILLFCMTALTLHTLRDPLVLT
jgi:hypothetical protein